MNNKVIKTSQGTFPISVLEKDIYDVSLPEYLDNDIKALLKGIKEDSNLLDCLMYEVYSSINMAYFENEISGNQDNHLREKYLLMSCKGSDDKDAK